MKYLFLNEESRMKFFKLPIFKQMAIIILWLMAKFILVMRLFAHKK